ncbi:MAG: 2-oxoacid:acceptor oxidoreductase family protein [bacterium JZ-2024 1]
MIEIRFHGRGGQGAVIASKILSVAFFKEGKYVQSFPMFGVERRGAPVTAFLRVGDRGETLFVRGNILHPDHIIILDPTLLTGSHCLEGLKPDGLILINSPLSPEDVPITGNYRIATVNASEIAVKWKLGTRAQPVVNTAILGAYVALTQCVSLETLKEAIGEEVPKKQEDNISAAEEAYYSVKEAKNETK